MGTNLSHNAKSHWTAALLATSAMLFSLGHAQTTWAQAAPKTKAPAASSTAPAKPAPKPAALSAADIAAKNDILKSSAWQETSHNFDQWLSAQTIYEPSQVKQIKRRMSLGVERMTPAQLLRFQSDIQEKLEVLNSSEAKQAGAYLAETFSVASPAYARKIRAKLPDVLTMTAAQINQQLDVFASKHAATLAAQKTFESDRQQSIAYNEAQITAMREESDRALARASAGSAGSGKSGGYSSARDYFPNVGNDGPFGPGTSYGGGFGGFGFF